MAFTVLGFTISWPLVGAIVAILIIREIWRVTYFKRKGFKGPTPYPLIGNSDFFKGFHKKSIEYTEKYGSVFGLFLFSNKCLFVSDLEMIKDITVKSFSKFMNHKTFVLRPRPFEKGITSLQGQHWKDVRNVLSPTFSAVKMKQLAALINESSDTLVKNFGTIQEEEGKVKVFSIFEAFTMDGIAKCAFGLQIDSQNDPNDPFVTHAGKLMGKGGVSIKGVVKSILAGLFPGTIGKAMNFLGVSSMPSEVANFFTSVIDQAIALRKENKDLNRKDFLQLMLDTTTESAAEEKEKKVEGDLHALIDEQDNANYFDLKKSKKTTLTMEEIYGQAMIFFLAGYETINITLGYLAYALASNPDIQEKLIDEVDSQTPKRDEVNYTSIAKMSFLDNVVCEVLRMYPPLIVTERECNETHVCNGYTIEKGIQVFFPVYAIHHDPQVWPEPEKFDPDRFTKENREGRHPLAWMPFGAGPRNCIGMRFGLMEVKMAIVRLLQNYRFETCPETEVKFTFAGLKPTNDLVLRVVPRS